MITGNEPAQPLYGVNGKLLGQMDTDYMKANKIFTGLTIRQQFAMAAPSKIPSWFKHEQLVKPIHPFPEWQKIENLDDQKEVKYWLDDGVYDLPDRLRWFQEAVSNHNAEKRQLEIDNKIERYFQWRAFFANRLINELNKQPE